jgi:ParB family transcriptional regulator, chromosome partitioning protein
VLETRVKVELGRRKGKIVVEFATMDDLDRIVKAMSPDADPAEPPGSPAVAS